MHGKEATQTPTGSAPITICWGHNQEQDKHCGGPSLGSNCFNGNKQTAKVLPEVKNLNLPYHPQRKQILDCLEWTML